MLTGWNTKDAMAFKYNRGKEDGKAEARNELFALWESGVSLEEAKKQLKLS